MSGASPAHATVLFVGAWAILAALGLGSPARATPASSPEGIIGGTPTQVGQYPTVVGLEIGDRLCTGTLVAPTWVLTAAHCLDPNVLGLSSQDELTRIVRVHFNTVDLTRDLGTVVNASASFRDPLFGADGTLSHDLGLIQLATPVTDISPSPINVSAAMAPAGTVVTIVGFGATLPGGQGNVGVEYELPNKASGSCSTLGIGANDSLLCFPQVDHRGTCFGDSGGPAFAMVAGRQAVVGVTSFGDQQCTDFAADTRADIARPFLVTHAPELGGCTGDQDCPSHRICFDHTCIAEPFGPGGLGSTCDMAGDCDSALCAGRSGEGPRCSLICSPSDGSSCPDGFECLKAGSFSTPECWPVSGGCCAAGGDGGPGATVLGLGVIALARRRRRQ